MDLPKLLVITILLEYVHDSVGEDLRLVGALEPYEGRLEIYHAGEWGSICIDNWHRYEQNAIIACSQLGFKGGSFRGVIEGEEGPGRFWMDDVICEGNEDQFSSCKFNGWDIHNCAHYLYQDVYLICEPKLVMRLIGGDNQYEGRLEIFTYDYGWLSVCIQGWTGDNSQVACRQLGLSGGSAKTATDTQSGVAAFWDIGVECLGNERRIDDCLLDRSRNIICSHTSPVEDIFLTCEPVTAGVLRLERGQSQFRGRLEVWYDGEWGTVCEDEWGNFPQNAQVACRQLGYSGGSHRRVTQMVNLAVKFWIDNLQCQNNERRISDCMFGGWGNEDCFHALFDDVFLTCKPYRDASIRVVGGSDKYEGRLEVYVAGEWGGICINKWDENLLNAHVACRQLGFTGGTFRHLNISERGTEKFWMDNIECRGDEINLGECFFNGWGVTNCAHFSNGVFLTCNPNKGDIRLLEGATEYEGKVSVFTDGRWNLICGENWYNTNAAITCQHLGLNGGLATSVLQNTTESILDFEFYCGRNSKELLTCPTRTTYCTSNTVALALCYAPVTYGFECLTNQRCVGNAICIESDGSGKCVCENEEHTYWDDTLQFCIRKSLYGQVCAMNMSSCENNLKCQETVDINRCACENDTFWNYSSETCLPKKGYNETCVSRGCRSNLMCLDFENSSRCACYGDTEQFWNEANKTCDTKLGAQKVCDPTIADQCKRGFECHQMNANASYTCLCAGNDSFWDGNINLCRRKLSFNETCSSNVTRMCSSNLICLGSDDSSRCLCENNTFWDIENSSCNDRLGNNATCNPDMPDSCMNGLECRKPEEDMMFKCLCAENAFVWDVQMKTCYKQSLHNETCTLNVPNICHGNLICLTTDESSRCLCDPNIDQFWNKFNGSCTMRLSYNEQCIPPLTECTEGLICYNEDGDNIYRCVCPDYQVWDSTSKQCSQNETLISIYVPDKLNIMDAIVFCDEEYSGRLASKDEFEHHFVDCVDFAEDFWLLSNISSEEHSTNVCMLVYGGVDVKSVNCSETHSFVCVIFDNHVSETCKDFPVRPVTTTTNIISQPRQATATSSGLLWWVLAAALSLIVIGVVCMAIVFRRRELGYNQWKRRKSLLGTSKVVHNELYNPHEHDNDNVGPTSPVLDRIRKSIFTSSKKVKSDSNLQSKASTENNSSESEHPNAVYAVVNKKKKSMKRGKLNSTSSAVSENVTSTTPHVINETAETPGGDPRAADSGPVYFNNLYDSFAKSLSITNPDNTYDHPPPPRKDSKGDRV